RRQNSTVRMPVANIFASTIVPSPRSMSRHGTPRQPSSTASARPTGPPPTMSTGGSAVDTARGRSGERQRRAGQILGAIDLDQDAVSFLVRIAVLLGLDQATPYFLVHRARLVDLRGAVEARDPALRQHAGLAQLGLAQEHGDLGAVTQVGVGRAL